MNVIKKYWKWDENLNTSDFKLGSQIKNLIGNGFAFSGVDSLIDEYNGKNGYPWKIITENGEIKSIFFRESFFDFEITDIWNLPVEDFEINMNKVLTPVNEDSNGDILYVVFRDFFVAIVGIIRK